MTNPQNQTYFYMGADHGPAILILVAIGTLLMVIIGLILIYTTI